MTIKAVKTHKITTSDTLFAILDRYITHLENRSIIVLASKIVAICQKRIVYLTEDEKNARIIKEADLYLPKEHNKYDLFITIKDNYLTYSSGIDESNVSEGMVLWPENPQNVACDIRAYCKEKFKQNDVGVIITDMAAIPLQKGVIAGAIAYSGFKPFRDITGKPDIFGRKFKYSWEGHLQGLAAAAGVAMGEGNQQTPLGIITDIPFVEFEDRNPTKEELDAVRMDPDQDLYGPLIKAVNWEKGGRES